MKFTENQKEILKRKFEEIKKDLIWFNNELVDSIVVKVQHKYLDVGLALGIDYISINVAYMKYYIFRKAGLDGCDTVGFDQIYTLIYSWDNIKIRIKDIIEKQNSVFK